MALAAAVLFGGCPHPRAAPPAGTAGTPAWTFPTAGDPTAVAIAGDAAFVTTGRSLQRLDGGVAGWRAELGAEAGAMAVAGEVVAVALAGSGPLDGLPLGFRGEPGAAIAGHAASDGARRRMQVSGPAVKRQLSMFAPPDSRSSAAGAGSPARASARLNPACRG